MTTTTAGTGRTADSASDGRLDSFVGSGASSSGSAADETPGEVALTPFVGSAPVSGVASEAGDPGGSSGHVAIRASASPTRSAGVGSGLVVGGSGPPNSNRLEASATGARSSSCGQEASGDSGCGMGERRLLVPVPRNRRPFGLLVR